jgi:DNA (cytosine-5)-methyltransferase 1
MNELALFAGAGGGILGGHLLGWRTVCAVEWEAYPASVLVARQNDKILPPFPIWDDVQTFDGKPWRGVIDVVSGGFPCQDISAAGGGAGITGARSSMWKHMARIIGEVRPRYAFVENSPMLTTRGLGTVIGDFSEMGYDTEWCVLGANDVGANHKRDRIWILAYTNSKSDAQRGFNTSISETGGQWNSFKGRGGRNVNGIPEPTTNEEMDAQSGYTVRKLANSTKQRCQKCSCSSSHKIFASNVGGCSCNFGYSSDWWASEPNVGRVANGVAARVDRLKAIGNGQVPLCAATAWNILKGRIDESK